MSYIEIYDFPFDTGDLLLFHGNTYGKKHCFSHLLNLCIECCTHSKFSHSAIIVRDPKFSPIPLEGLYILESTGLENVPDAENNEIKFGVQLRKLSDVLKNYDGDIYWRKLDCERNQKFYQNLSLAHSVVHNRPYDAGVDYIKAMFISQVGNMHKKKTFFCSALCAYVYTVLGILPFDTPWTIVTPHDLSSETRRPILLKWQNCILHDEIRI